MKKPKKARVWRGWAYVNKISGELAKASNDSYDISPVKPLSWYKERWGVVRVEIREKLK